MPDNVRHLKQCLVPVAIVPKSADNIIDSLKMRLLCSSVTNGEKNYIILSANNAVLVVDDCDWRVKKELVCNKSDGSSIISISVDNNGKWIFAAFSNKCGCCWDFSTGEILGTITFAKHPTALAHASFKVPTGENYDILLISNKAGHIGATNIPDMKNYSSLAGHTASLITDMVVSPCGHFLATSDRDEKIKISNIPHLTIIESFCLAHTNVVNSLSFINYDTKNFLVSCGWDHRLCLWDFINGILIHECFLTSNSSTLKISRPDLEIAVNSTANDILLTAESETLTSSEVKPGGEVITDSERDREVEGEDTGIENDEDSPENIKQYDADQAGNFPMKAVCSSSMNVIAVIFRGQARLECYRVAASLPTTPTPPASQLEHNTCSQDSKTSPSATDDLMPSVSYSFQKIADIPLKAIPCDVTFTTNGSQLVMILPPPHYIQILTVTMISTSIEEPSLALVDVEVEDRLSTASSPLQVIRETCLRLGCLFTQRLVFSHVTDADDDTGTVQERQES